LSVEPAILYLLATLQCSYFRLPAIFTRHNSRLINRFMNTHYIQEIGLVYLLCSNIYSNAEQ